MLKPDSVCCLKMFLLFYFFLFKAFLSNSGVYIPVSRMST